jgi:hypothetical protein
MLAALPAFALLAFIDFGDTAPPVTFDDIPPVAVERIPRAMPERPASTTLTIDPAAGPVRYERKAGRLVEVTVREPARPSAFPPVREVVRAAMRAERAAPIYRAPPMYYAAPPVTYYAAPPTYHAAPINAAAPGAVCVGGSCYAVPSRPAFGLFRRR